ncbi:unnamed protein product, partial [Vitis vinifera]
MFLCTILAIKYVFINLLKNLDQLDFRKIYAFHESLLTHKLRLKMVVVEAFLSSLFEVVLDKLVAAPLLDYARQLKVDTAVLQEWRNTLLQLQAVLHDAEQRQIQDEAVKRWLDDLKALAYDIEDVLDDELSDEHCWSVFAYRAFENITPDAIKNLEPIGRKIVQKCKGLPLAAKTLGGLLRYHYLPTKVKQCFAYCSIFPKDYEYQKEELILLWAAQGFVGDFKGEEMIEDGEKCFRNLLSRSFFQQSSQNKSLLVMHDLIHDLAQFASREFSYVPTCYLADKVLHDLLPTFRCLRVLSLSHYNITHLPDSFQNLKHLQYLNLSSTKIKKLPKSIGMLCNLQSLMLSNCHGITELPPEIENLIHLHHLDISGTKLEGMPIGINKLKDLRRLTTFVVGKHSGARIAELQDLDSENQTRVLENLQPHTKVKRLNIQHYYGRKFPKWFGDPSFMNLVFLRLEDCNSCSSLPPLGQLQSLKDLQIAKMDGVQNVEILRFEDMLEWEKWICCDIKFPCLKELYIKKCPKLKGDIPRHLPLLTKLEISESGQLECCVPMAPSIRELILSSFPEMALPPMLERLEIRDCRTLESLPEGMMQNNTTLQYLEIRDCCSLRSLPRDIDSLKTLAIYECKKLELALHEDMTHNHYASLTNFMIWGIGDSLTSFPLASFTKLETLELWDCTNLEYLYIPDGLHHVDLTSLQILYIANCPNLVSFPQGGLPTPNLTSLWIKNCKKLKGFAH